MPSLADDEKFTQAIGAMEGGEVIAWGYSDTAAAIDSMRDAMQDPFGGMAGAGMGEEMQDLPPEFQDLQNLDLEFIKRFVGPSVWQIRSTPSGFLFTTYVLEPTDVE